MLRKYGPLAVILLVVVVVAAVVVLGGGDEDGSGDAEGAGRVAPGPRGAAVRR